MGMDVLAWCTLGIVDVLIVHGGSSGFLMQQEVDVRWASEAAFSSPNEHCWVYVSVGGVPCERHSTSATMCSLRGFLRVARFGLTTPTCVVVRRRRSGARRDPAHVPRGAIELRLVWGCWLLPRNRGAEVATGRGRLFRAARAR